MSFVFRGSRGDLEGGFQPVSNFLPERRNVRFHGAGRTINANPMAFLVTLLLLFMLLNSQQVSSNFLLWLGMGVFLMATSLRMYAMCQQLQAQAHAHAAAAAAAAAAASGGGLVGHTELRLRMPPSIAFATRGHLQGLRLQLALLDREFDDLDYDALRALDGDNVPGVDAMSEAEIRRLPLHKYKSSSGHQPSSSNQVSDPGAPSQLGGGTSTSPDTNSKKTDVGTSDSTKQQASEEELTCSVCLEQVGDGEMVRSLPCLHQFHASCIDQWLRQQATCPVCKFRLVLGWQESDGGEATTFMV